MRRRVRKNLTHRLDCDSTTGQPALPEAGALRILSTLRGDLCRAYTTGLRYVRALNYCSACECRRGDLGVHEVLLWTTTSGSWRIAAVGRSNPRLQE
jgi:hypothetical protein